jgi:hypothetical protein
MRSHDAPVTRVLALIFGVYGMSAAIAGASDQGSSLLQAQPFHRGENFVYERHVLFNAPDANHNMTSTYRLTIDSVAPSGATATLSKVSTDKSALGQGSFPISIDPKGAWVGQHGVPEYNFVTLDPRLYCSPPPNLNVGKEWGCNTGGIPRQPSGTSSIRVVAIDGSTVRLLVDGTHKDSFTKIDPDNGQPYQVYEFTVWHETLILTEGILIRDSRQMKTHTDISNLHFDAVETADLTLASHSP